MESESETVPTYFDCKTRKDCISIIINKCQKNRGIHLSLSNIYIYISYELRAANTTELRLIWKQLNWLYSQEYSGPLRARLD